jgi:hypothetical protein
MRVGSTDRANDDLSSVDADANLDGRIAGFAQACRIFAHFALDPESCVQRPMRVILVRHRRTEQGEDSVTGDCTMYPL